MSDPASPDTLAAVDLGSNSFHMVVARLLDSEPVMVDRIREQVQLRAGLDEERKLSREARDRALACLKRFGQRLRGMPANHVRVVGTNTLRRAKNAAEFVNEAEEALGHRIEILSGAEEARLIYLGVSHTSAAEESSRLVVDIGGGSTECILGVKFEPRYFQSLEMGCISYSRAFFPDGAITRKGFDEAETAARLELRRHQRKFRQKGWSSVFGASGTIRAVREVLRSNDWSEGGITSSGLKRLRRELIHAKQVDQVDLSGLKSERAPVFAGGVAILISVFDSLGLEVMEASSGALREGALYDLLGRLRHEDVRDRTIRQFEERYRVDTRQANLVEGTALEAFDQVAAAWGLEESEARRFLAWAARLHEIGLTVSYEKHHRHGGYLVANSDMPGFSRNDQALLSSIIGSHRRRVRRGVFDRLSPRAEEIARKLILLLRLAVRFHRTRDWKHSPEFHVEADKRGLTVVCDGEWLGAQPMTRRDLEVEASLAEELGLRLRIEIA